MVAMETHFLTEKFILNSDFTIMLPILQIKNTVQNVDWIFLKMADQSYFVKIVLIVHHKSSQADIAHNSVNRSNNEQRTQKDEQIETNRWLTLQFEDPSASPFTP